MVLDQAIDTTTPSGRLLFHVLASIAEFERDLIRDRVIAGIRLILPYRQTRSPSSPGPPRAQDVQLVLGILMNWLPGLVSNQQLPD